MAIGTRQIRHVINALGSWVDPIGIRMTRGSQSLTYSCTEAAMGFWHMLKGHLAEHKNRKYLENNFK